MRSWFRHLWWRTRYISQRGGDLCTCATYNLIEAELDSAMWFFLHIDIGAFLAARYTGFITNCDRVSNDIFEYCQDDIDTALLLYRPDIWDIRLLWKAAATIPVSNTKSVHGGLTTHDGKTESTSRNLMGPDQLHRLPPAHLHAMQKTGCDSHYFFTLCRIAL